MKREKSVTVKASGNATVIIEDLISTADEVAEVKDNARVWVDGKLIERRKPSTY